MCSTKVIKNKMKEITTILLGLAVTALSWVICLLIFRQFIEDKEKNTNYAYYILGLIVIVGVLSTCNDKD